MEILHAILALKFENNYKSLAYVFMGNVHCFNSRGHFHFELSITRRRTMRKGRILVNHVVEREGSRGAELFVCVGFLHQAGAFIRKAFWTIAALRSSFVTFPFTLYSCFHDVKYDAKDT
jgi:hypothetical protein